VVFGPKVSSGNGVRMEPISNLRMFLSAKGLLGHVTKLRRSSGRIKPVGVVFDHRERERELNTWGVGAIGSVWEKGKSFTTVRSGEGAGRLSWKPFGVRQSGEVECAEA
jgi:hypothetical protein